MRTLKPTEVKVVLSQPAVMINHGAPSVPVSPVINRGARTFPKSSEIHVATKSKD